MFEMTMEQQEAWRSRVHSVDAALKSAVQMPEKPAKPARRLHLVQALHLMHAVPGGKSLAA
jgi:hypothetical protein